MTWEILLGVFIATVDERRPAVQSDKSDRICDKYDGTKVECANKSTERAMNSNQNDDLEKVARYSDNGSGSG